ncbi:MAG: hypothetical protein PWQ12_979 [Clostridiales bacterium]|nr:hypothetical protein [Clostridiales bacterium]
MKEMVCIVCPKGCHMKVERNQEEWIVTGNSCNRGKLYAIEEQRNPSRVVPTTVAVSHGMHPRLPVKTARPIPKQLIRRAMEEISKVEVDAPIEQGQVIIENLLGTGVDVVASRRMNRV